MAAPLWLCPSRWEVILGATVSETVTPLCISLKRRPKIGTAGTYLPGRENLFDVVQVDSVTIFQLPLPTPGPERREASESAG